MFPASFTVMTTNATAAPARTAARRYSEQLHVLVDEQTRAYVLGMATLTADAGGYARPREGELVRDLLDEAIALRYKRDRPLYEAAVIRGREVLAERAGEAKARQADTTRMVEAVAASRA
jgi:hypothetical protein